jgi:hypothetical protein
VRRNLELTSSTADCLRFWGLCLLTGQWVRSFFSTGEEGEFVNGTRRTPLMPVTFSSMGRQCGAQVRSLMNVNIREHNRHHL